MAGTRKKGVNSTTCEYNIRKITMAHESSCVVREKKTMAHEKDWQMQDNKEPKYMLSTIN